MQRGPNFASDPTFPGCADYFTHKEAETSGSLLHKNSNSSLHGGSPNNILTLQRAE
jgi:hypothetical protein